MKALAALAALLSGLSTAAPRESPQDKQLARSCTTTLTTVQTVVEHAATSQPALIVGHLRILTPGKLQAKIAFNPSGSSITLAGDAFAAGARAPSAARLRGAFVAGYTCGAGVVGTGLPPGLGHSQVVSTLQETFPRPGRYMLSFVLSARGRRILGRLGARDRAYHRRHPHGHRPPTVAFGVSFRYAPTG